MKSPIKAEQLQKQLTETQHEIMLTQVAVIRLRGTINSHQECLAHLESARYSDTKSPHLFLWMFPSQSLAEKRDAEVRKIARLLFERKLELSELEARIGALEARYATLQTYFQIAEAAVRVERQKATQQPAQPFLA